MFFVFVNNHYLIKMQNNDQPTKTTLYAQIEFVSSGRAPKFLLCTAIYEDGSTKEQRMLFRNAPGTVADGFRCRSVSEYGERTIQSGGDKVVGSKPDVEVKFEQLCGSVCNNSACRVCPRQSLLKRARV